MDLQRCQSQALKNNDWWFKSNKYCTVTIHVEVEDTVYAM